MRTLLTVFGKEFHENLRDRRTLLSALLFGPLFGPLLFGLMVSRMLDQSVAESDEPRAAVRGGSAKIVLIIPEEYGPRFSAATPAPVLLVADSADSQTRKIADRARGVI